MSARSWGARSFMSEVASRFRRISTGSIRRCVSPERDRNCRNAWAGVRCQLICHGGIASMAKLNVNGRLRDVQAEADTPLLWVIREQVGLTGTKYGCGRAQWGA